VTSGGAGRVVGATRETPETVQLVEQAAGAFLTEYRGTPSSELILVMPAFNEEASVASVVRALPAEIDGITTSTLVMDDGSTDGTVAEARRAGAMVCSLGHNVGQGVVLRLGYRLAGQRGADYIATADADGQFDPGELPGLLAPIVAGEADFVNGSRRLGRNKQTDVVRRLGVVFFGRLISLLTGVRITDPSNGLRVWRREVTETLPLRQTQYQTSELLIRTVAHGFRVKEVPATMYERSAGESKKGRNWLYGVRFARVILTTWWEERSRIGGFALRRRARP
jgi:glycosyltransferase involved in cell wall biosynthesis